MALLSPTLPPELESQIFEIYALSRPRSIPRLMLVAKRVKEWMEPLLYRTMAVGSERPIAGFPSYSGDIVMATIRDKPPSFFFSAVRNLATMNFNTYDVEAVLAACSGVENLWLPGLKEAWMPLIAALPLKRLCTDCYPILRALPPTHQVFSRLTHLELEDLITDPEDCNALATPLSSLPRLTHLSFSLSGLIPLCPRMLESCAGLRALVCLNTYAISSYNAHEPALAQDVRFVVMRLPRYVEDWYAGAQSGADYWSRAETFIAERRAKKRDPFQYVIPE
ncbi:hypothetical protein MVEN_00448300 [Mycena venus]|uniref:Uncharacterized protein n=1 Tax=Mycena venus TaxID=2733690 RepID=A0A8H6YR85_9AGAR|nr:hypothetical protein MVEN_00448300 [Mycena venus]